MLVDLDAFYVSVERRHDPSLCEKPVIVGGVPGERGVVASASYEARAYGVRAGMPLARAAALCPKAVFLHGDHARYQVASTEVLEILREFSPQVEPVSLDEAFLDVTGCERVLSARSDLELASVEPEKGESGGLELGEESPRRRGPLFFSWLAVAERIHREIARRAGLSVSIGVGGTKTVASVAAGLAKPAGALEVPRGAEAPFLAGLPVDCLPGVGPRTREALARFNLHTIGDLARLPEDLLEETFGRQGVSISRRARGLDDEPVVDGRPTAKSISRETSFAEDTADRAVVGGMLSYLAQRAMSALRASGMRARSVAVRLRYADFETVEARRRLSGPTDRDRDVLAAVEVLWPRRWDRRVKLRLVGVSLGDLEPAGPRQLELFDDLDPVMEPALLVEQASAAASPASSGRLDAAIDAVRARHGFGSVVKGRAIDCLSHFTHDARGFRLRTPSCSA